MTPVFPVQNFFSQKFVQNIVLGILVLGGLYLISSTLFYVWDFAFLEPFSDYEAALERYAAYEAGNMTLLSALFTRHGGHPHALVFALAFADILLTHGQDLLLKGATWLSHFLFLGLLAGIYFTSPELSRTEKASLSLWTILTMFTPSLGEIWVTPFQAVLPTFYLLAASGLFCFSWGLRNVKRLFSIGAAFLLLIAVVSHGAGIILIPVLLIGVWINKGRGWGVPFLVCITYGFYNYYFPFSSSFSADVAALISPSHWLTLLFRTLYLLGSPITGPGSVGLSLTLGLLGTFLFLRVLLKRWSLLITNPRYLFFVLYGFFCWGATLLSVLFNIVRFHLENEMIAGSSAFFSHRYWPAAFGFWTATLYLTLAVSSKKGSWQKILFVLVGFSTFYVSIQYYTLWATTRFAQNEVWAAHAVGQEARVPSELRAKAYGVPVEVLPMIDNRLAIQSHFQLGRYHAPEYPHVGEKVTLQNPEEKWVKVTLIEPLKGKGVRVRGSLLPGGHLTGFFPLVDRQGVIKGVGVVNDFRRLEGNKEASFVGYAPGPAAREYYLVVKPEKPSLFRMIIEKVERSLLSFHRTSQQAAQHVWKLGKERLFE